MHDTCLEEFKSGKQLKFFRLNVLIFRILVLGMIVSIMLLSSCKTCKCPAYSAYFDATINGDAIAMDHIKKTSDIS